jgi:hypothetical protein
MAKLAKIKTTETEQSVDDFISKIPDEQKRKDCETILKMMKKASKEKPKLWGSAIIGYGNVIVKSPNSGREVAWFRIGFSPRKANFSLYLTSGSKKYDDLLKKLGKYKTGGGCLYINKLSDIDTKVLQEIFDKAADAKWFE